MNVETKYRLESLKAITNLFGFTASESQEVRDFLTGIVIRNKDIIIDNSDTDKPDYHPAIDRIYNEAEIIEIINNHISSLEENIESMKIYLKDIQDLTNK